MAKNQKFKVGDKVIISKSCNKDVWTITNYNPIRDKTAPYRIEDDNGGIAWAGKDALECDHQWGSTYYTEGNFGPYSKKCTQCGEYEEAWVSDIPDGSAVCFKEKKEEKTKPEVKVGQVWEWVTGVNRDCGEFIIEEIDGANFCYGYKNPNKVPALSEKQRRKLKTLHEHAKLIKDVPAEQIHFTEGTETIESWLGPLDETEDVEKKGITVDDCNELIGLSLGKDVEEEPYGIVYWIKPDKKFLNARELDINYLTGEKKMKKATTVLEKKALAEAKEQKIKMATAEKKLGYEKDISAFVEKEQQARIYRAEADELKKVLGLTKSDIDELI